MPGQLEDITNEVVSINVPVVVIAGERDTVELVATLKEELLPPYSPGNDARVTGYGPPLAAGGARHSGRLYSELPSHSRSRGRRR